LGKIELVKYFLKNDLNIDYFTTNLNNENVIFPSLGNFDLLNLLILDGRYFI
jgi:hypothetical protein